MLDVPGLTVNMGNGKTEIGGGRPGMTNVVQTADGKWMLTYEYWGGGANVGYRIAADPLRLYGGGPDGGAAVPAGDTGSPTLATGGSPVLIRLPADAWFTTPPAVAMSGSIPAASAQAHGPSTKPMSPPPTAEISPMFEARDVWSFSGIRACQRSATAKSTSAIPRCLPARETKRAKRRAPKAPRMQAYGYHSVPDSRRERWLSNERRHIAIRPSRNGALNPADGRALRPVDRRRLVPKRIMSPWPRTGWPCSRSCSPRARTASPILERRARDRRGALRRAEATEAQSRGHGRSRTRAPPHNPKRP